MIDNDRPCSEFSPRDEKLTIWIVDHPVDVKWEIWNIRGEVNQVGRTLFILWKPYMLRWRIKLENCSGVGRRIEVEGERTLLCLKCEPRMLLLNSPTLETTKLKAMNKGLNQSQNTNLVPSSVHASWIVDHDSVVRWVTPYMVVSQIIESKIDWNSASTSACSSDQKNRRNEGWTDRWISYM